MMISKFSFQQPRGNDIFGFAGYGDDDIPYMTLSYGNGNGYYDHWNVTHGGRIDPTTLDTERINFRFPTTLPRIEETHGGDDVGIWAVGPWAHLFRGTLEQHVIPHIMAYASCIGNGKTACDD
jgi:alkaline phosphatase